MDGILLVDKGKGLTSRQVVDKVKRILRARPIGHAGSLDPMATGLLLVAMGEGTKLVEILMDAGKVYEATVKLGEATDTDDAEGAVTRTLPVPDLTTAHVEAALARFRGEFTQVPPRFSALKVEGVRAYERARGGEEFELAGRSVRVDELDLLGWESPALRVRVQCGRGTYIRSLARDLGEALGTCGHLTALRRTSVGPYLAADAVRITTDFTPARDDLRGALVPLRRSFGAAPAVRIREEYLGDLRFGRSPLPAHLLDPVPQGEGVRFLLVDESMEPLAVAEPDPVTGGGRLRRVLRRAATAPGRS